MPIGPVQHQASGMPRASVKQLRVTLPLPQSGGFVQDKEAVVYFFQWKGSQPLGLVKQIGENLRLDRTAACFSWLLYCLTIFCPANRQNNSLAVHFR